MLILALVGLFFILLSGIMNAIELRRFFKALNLLNQCTITMKDKIIYPIRLVKISKYLTPVIPDLILMALSGSVGLGGGVIGFIISMGGTCFVTICIKIALKLNKYKGSSVKDFNSELAKI